MPQSSPWLWPLSSPLPRPARSSAWSSFRAVNTPKITDVFEMHGRSLDEYANRDDGVKRTGGGRQGGRA
ncbi:hypothetical protein Agabi119p4_2901 [Agaricus bisporus var. burnettii]|uniref:Uncharacterized protein n=1 Tax=Agaricus bisporus var. burnettii TaxID=192524 RepID=A0A8H7F637_AGABI|nr:hypothetical protein Agabi119p4_2901 [Agaricus bisporus var. burnettii]